MKHLAYILPYPNINIVVVRKGVPHIKTAAFIYRSFRDWDHFLSHIKLLRSYSHSNMPMPEPRKLRGNLLRWSIVSTH